MFISDTSYPNYGMRHSIDSKARPPLFELLQGNDLNLRYYNDILKFFESSKIWNDLRKLLTLYRQLCVLSFQV